MRILGFACNCKDLPVDGQSSRASVPDRVVRLSEGQCVLQSAYGCDAAAAVPLGGRGNWIGMSIGLVDPARRQEYPQGYVQRPRLRT